MLGILGMLYPILIDSYTRINLLNFYLEVLELLEILKALDNLSHSTGAETTKDP